MSLALKASQRYTPSPSKLNSDNEDLSFISRVPLRLVPSELTLVDEDLLSPDSPPHTPPRRANSLPPLSSEPDFHPSSPIKGDRSQMNHIRRRKSQKKRLETLTKKNKQKAYEATQREAELAERVSLSLRALAQYGLTLGGLCEYVFDPANEMRAERWETFFRSPGRATRILNWWSGPGNSTSARNEVHEWAVKYVCNRVTSEARSITRSKLLYGVPIDSDSITSFSFKSLYEHLSSNVATVAIRVLTAFSTSRRQIWAGVSKARNSKKIMVITAAAISCLGEFSRSNILYRRMIGLYLYAVGAQRQLVTVVSHFGLSESYSRLIAKSDSFSATSSHSASDVDKRKRNGTLAGLSYSMLSSARNLAQTGIFGLVYDNIDFMLRTAEPIYGRNNSSEHGTCATLWTLFQTTVEDLDLTAVTDAAAAAGELTKQDIIHTSQEAEMFEKCMIHNILRIIVRFGGEGFKKFEKDLEKNAPCSVSKIPVHETKFYPLPTMEINESTIIGNAEVDEALVNVLKLRESPQWMKTARLVAGDQLSLARLRTVHNIRAGKEGSYAGFGWCIPIPGLFHVKMADMHGMFTTHWGRTDAGNRNPGSLNFHNNQLYRHPITITSLPPFRTCRDLVFVSLYARILHCLLLVSKIPSLEEYSTKVTSWDMLYEHATSIYTTYADTQCVSQLRWQRRSARYNAETAAQTAGQHVDRMDTPTQPTLLSEGDMVFENAILFLRDALISREFSDGVKMGDSGRILLVMKMWALSFRGNGRTKYAYEMLHLIHNLSHIWPENIRKVVLNNWLVNTSNKPDGFLEVDLMQEHLNFWIKTFYKARGSNASWEWLSMISPCVEALRHLANVVKNVLGTDIGTKHATPDLSKDIRVLMDSLAEHEVYIYKNGRTLDDNDDSTTDVISVGMDHLMKTTNSPLNDYNKAFQHLQRRRATKPVVDDTQPDGPDPNPPTFPTSLSRSDPAACIEVSTVQDEGDIEMDVEDDYDVLMEGESELTQLLSGADEPTLTLATEEDVALDMDTEMAEDKVGLLGYDSEGDSEGTDDEGDDIS